MKKIYFIGAGKVGTSLAYLFNQKGYEIIGIGSRNLKSAEASANFVGNNITATNDILVFVEEADIVFITTNDDAIPFVVQDIANRCEIFEGQIFIHTSGSLPASVFGPLEKKGAFGISIHPLQTVASPSEGVNNLIGSLFAIEGNLKAYDTALELVRALDGQPFFIDSEKKPLYHLAAVIACNYFVTLINTSMKIFENVNIDTEKGLVGLLKLVRGTINNIEKVGPKQALTGPIARGDIHTIEGHIVAMKKYMPELIELYKILGKMTVDIAKEKGTLSESKGKKILEILREN
ncbi:MAG: DUF2520 domain-containing protein [Proteobacteria bacterium]|nr:DUF2520 domain-containing protein [Pseudomonadota bacterium]